jgi:hypothetical protein
MNFGSASAQGAPDGLGPVFLSAPVPSGCTLIGGAIQTHVLDSDGQNLLLLQPSENPIQHSRFTPAIHPRVDRMPVAKLLWQASPFATMLHHIKEGIEQLQIGHAHVAAAGNRRSVDTDSQ